MIIRSLLGGQRPALARTLGLTEPAECGILHAADWKSLDGATFDTALFHYELTRTQTLRLGVANDPSLRILNCADRVTFVTLWEDPDILAMRLRAKIRITVISQVKARRFRQAWKTYRRNRLRRPYVTQAQRLWPLYEQWCAFCTRFSGSPQWILHTGGADGRPHALVQPVQPFWSVNPNGNS